MCCWVISILTLISLIKFFSGVLLGDRCFCLIWTAHPKLIILLFNPVSKKNDFPMQLNHSNDYVLAGNVISGWIIQYYDARFFLA